MSMLCGFSSAFQTFLLFLKIKGALKNLTMDETTKNLDLPQQTQHYHLRIAGHTHMQDKIRLDILKHDNGNILKPLLSGDIRAVRELSFYQQIFESHNSDPDICDLKMYIPSFHGTWETTINDTNVKYLCTEDICGRFENPSVLDVKIGAITYDPLASEEKIKKDVKKYPSLETFKFRILGIKVFDHSKGTYTTISKKFGLTLTTPEKVNAGLGMFFQNKLGQINCLVLSGLLHKLLQLKSWFMKQRKFIFISSSILLVYESNLSSWLSWIRKKNMHVMNLETCKQFNENSSKELICLHHADCSPVFSSKNVSTHSEKNDLCNDCNLPQIICSDLQKDCALFRISMIDFAHVFPTSEEDSNYILGLSNLISHWQLLLINSMQRYL